MPKQSRTEQNLAWYVPYQHKDIVAKEFGDRCYMCGKPVVPTTETTLRRGNGAVKDHIIPLSQGGWDAPFNVRIACHRCDNLKGNDPSRVNIWALLPDYRPPVYQGYEVLDDDRVGVKPIIEEHHKKPRQNIIKNVYCLIDGSCKRGCINHLACKAYLGN